MATNEISTGNSSNISNVAKQQTNELFISGKSKVQGTLSSSIQYDDYDRDEEDAD